MSCWMEVEVTCTLCRCTVALMAPGGLGILPTLPWRNRKLGVLFCCMWAHTIVCIVAQLGTQSNNSIWHKNSADASHDHRIMKKWNIVSARLFKWCLSDTWQVDYNSEHTLYCTYWVNIFPYTPFKCSLRLLHHCGQLSSLLLLPLFAAHRDRVYLKCQTQCT